jgi:hypothetical protein
VKVEKNTIVKTYNFYTDLLPSFCKGNKTIKKAITKSGVADLHHFNADPDTFFHYNADLDPSFHFNADSNPTFHINANPDTAPHQGHGNLRLLVYRPSTASF